MWVNMKYILQISNFLKRQLAAYNKNNNNVLWGFITYVYIRCIIKVQRQKGEIYTTVRIFNIHEVV